MRTAKSLLLATTLLAGTVSTAVAEVKVVASIKPVHSLVAAVMDGVGRPELIVEGASSPHTYALKPSQAVMLEEADIVFWIGHELEAFLEKPLETVAAKAKKVELMDVHGLEKLGFREGGEFDEHDHGDHKEKEHGHDDHKEHEHAEKHDYEKKHEDERDHAKKDDHHAEDKEDAHKHDEHDHHGRQDPHIWLDPVNAKAIVHEIEEALANKDPENAAVYEKNAHAVMAQLDALTAEISADLKSVKAQRFVVFHDAYHYFENRFGLKAAGSITISPEVMPGAERIHEVREHIEHAQAACVFAEPQFEPKLVETVVEHSKVRTGVLDPLGVSLQAGAGLYFELLRGMASSFKSCLGSAS
jgi:zinc transport system substrate-binding protein